MSAVLQRHFEKSLPYPALFEACPEALLLFDPYGNEVLGANDAACAMLGYAPKDLVGSRVTSLYAGQLGGLVVFTEAVLHKGRTWSLELPLRTGDGTELHLEYAAARVDGEDGPLILAVLTDPQARRTREADAEADAYLRSGLGEWRRIEHFFRELERRNQLILSAAGEGIYGVNAEGKTTFVNPAAERLLGWSAEELVGEDMHCIVHHSHADGSDYAVEDCPIYAAFCDGTVHQAVDEVFWRKDGTPLHVDYTSTPIRDRGMLVGAVIVFRDIGHRKEAEAKLQAALDEVNRLRERLELENAYLQEEIRTEFSHRELIGRSAAVQKLIRQIELVAPTDASVLVTGESGTGKELIARAIHDASNRRERPLIRVNCAAVPRELFESEFFGHVKGAFTGALRDRVGRFELADGGTLFLDEVGEIPLELQGKLLRVLQERQFERVGEASTRMVDVRVVAATNRDLKAAVRNGQFREDLYFRLNVFPIESVPLRERIVDIPLLATHFLERASRKLNKPGLRLTQSHLRQFSGYPWPGNVRELENIIERAVIVAQGQRLGFDLPDASVETPIADEHVPETPYAGVYDERERLRRDKENIMAALALAEGKVFGPGGAAERLGIPATTLASRMKTLGIQRRPGDDRGAASLTVGHATT